MHSSSTQEAGPREEGLCAWCFGRLMRPWAAWAGALFSLFSPSYI